MKPLLWTRRHTLRAAAGLAAPWAASRAYGAPSSAPGSPGALQGLGPSEILIGQVMTLQAGRHEAGVAVRQGVAAGLAVIHANGGIHGRRLTLRVLDDQGDPAQATALGRQLLAQGMFALFGPHTPGPCRALMALAEAEDVPLVAPMAGLWPPTDGTGRHTLAVRATLAEEFHVLMRQAQALGMVRIAVLHLADGAGAPQLNLARTVAARLNLPPPLGLPARPGQSASEWQGLVDRVRQGEVAVVIAGGDGVLPLDRLLRSLREAGLHTPCWGVSTGAAEVLRRLGSLAAGMRFTQVVPDPWTPRSAWVREYQAAFRASFRDQPFSHASLEAYWSVRALADALRAAGPALSRSRLLDAWAESPPERPTVDTALVNAQGQWRH